MFDNQLLGSKSLIFTGILVLPYGKLKEMASYSLITFTAKTPYIAL